MEKSMTKNELFGIVSKFYSGYLDLEKALKLFEMEYYFKPTIIAREDIILMNSVKTRVILNILMVKL